ncbi:cytochrome b/b6 domain-containing protein [uncultured Paraglaciecola sp.]|uniref:cytochrome b/b6 domain-containing protein n=1 Tax=uncultured Paraglaciecola sp. TaxID=1765024 RepID=UPI0026164931|nr:cytochrome b/b6 domain-containing protein [uncultured Paraglaciecola sp.]
MKKKLVWDVPVRLFHWLLVLCIFGQWFTAEVLEDAMDIHFYIGYFTLGLIIFRLIWGFVGTKYARFSSFIAGPKTMLGYVRNLISKQHTFTIGHNSVGGLILPAIILLVGLQAISGLFTSDDVIYSGPYYDSASTEIQQYMQWLHHNIFDLLLMIIGLHLLAIFWYLVGLKHNLIGPMIHGKKVVSENDSIGHSQILKAILLICIVAIFVYWLVEINPPPIEDGYYY